MEKLVEAVITKEQIDSLLVKLEKGEVTVGEQSIMYSDYISKGVLPPLELLPVKVPGIKSTYRFSEYTSYCAKIAQPDFGTIEVTIIPKDNTIEMRSLRNYFIGYRNVDIFQEEACANTLIDIVRACDPQFCQVKGYFTPRGAMVTEATVTYHAE